MPQGMFLHLLQCKRDPFLIVLRWFQRQKKQDYDAGKLPVWQQTKVPEIALKYWKLDPEKATMRDVLAVIRADEVNKHVHANHNTRERERERETHHKELRELMVVLIGLGSPSRCEPHFWNSCQISTESIQAWLLSRIQFCVHMVFWVGYVFRIENIKWKTLKMLYDLNIKLHYSIYFTSNMFQPQLLFVFADTVLVVAAIHSSTALFVLNLRGLLLSGASDIFTFSSGGASLQSCTTAFNSSVRPSVSKCSIHCLYLREEREMNGFKFATQAFWQRMGFMGWSVACTLELLFQF